MHEDGIRRIIQKVFQINGFDLAPEKCDRNKARNISNDGHYGNRNQTIS